MLKYDTEAFFDKRRKTQNPSEFTKEPFRFNLEI